MLPAIVRYDEVQRGAVEHACRLVVAKSRYRNYIYPATHFAASTANTSKNLPAMGQRLRLKSSFVIPTNWTKEAKVISLGLKKYGAIVADNGSVFAISVTPDNRWPSNCFDNLTSISITNFEVIQTTDTNQGPRSIGAPVANAGQDQTIEFGQTAQLTGAVNYSNSISVIQWKAYSGPASVTFANVALTNTTVNFTAPGIYTLELSADDGVHAVAYDALVINVTNVIHLSIRHSGTNLNFAWLGGVAPFVVQQCSNLSPPAWSDLLTTGATSTNLPDPAATTFYRVKDSSL